MDAKKWAFLAAGTGVRECAFTECLRVFLASNGLDSRFRRKFTWNGIALVARSRHFVVNLRSIV